MDPQLSFEQRCDQVGRVLAGCNQRFDANETAAVTRALEHVKSRTYDIKYPALKGRELVPVSNEVNTGAESVVYEQWDEVGEAKLLANHADDLPAVDAIVREFSGMVKSIGCFFSYSIQDLRRAAMTGSQLDLRKARAARMFVERRIDEIIAYGDAEAGLTGFFGLSASTPVLAATGNWSGLTHAQILVDLHTLANSIVTLTKGVEIPDTIVLPVPQYSLIATSNNATTDRSTLEVFLAQTPYIKQVIPWFKAAGAGAAGVDRAVAYRKDPEVLEMDVPQEFEMMPLQPQNLAFKVPCHARVGRVTCPYPLAVAYQDGI